MGLNTLGGTIPIEMETIITTLRFKTDSCALIFNSCFHFQPKETKRWKKMWYLDGVSIARPMSLGMRFKFFRSLQEASVYFFLP